MPKQFIGEAIRPNKSSFDTSRMASGEPGLPSEFTWRGKRFKVASVTRTWRETGACTHKSGELYARQHWFEIITDTSQTMEIYFERKPRRGTTSLNRWRLFTVVSSTRER